MMTLEELFKWAGGAAFVASLAATALTYGVLFGRATPFNGWSPVAFDAGLVAVFAAHHSLLARDSLKAALALAVPDRLLRSVYVWTASLLLLLVCSLWRQVGGEIYELSGLQAGLVIFVQLSGVGLVARAVLAIDALDLAGIRTRADHEDLQHQGPYALVRHPLYLGWILVVFGTSHMTGDRLAFAAVTTLYLFIAIPWEERALARTFGEAYARYKREVRWRIIPYVY